MRYVRSGLMLLGLIVVLLAIGAGLYAYVPQARTYMEQVYETVARLAGGGITPDKGGLILPEGDGTLVESGEVSSLQNSEITGEEYLPDEKKYPYYTFLDENGQSVYKQVCANIEALETTFIPVTEITVSELEDVVMAVFNDHPEYFWIETGYSYRYTKDDNCVQISVSFNDTTDDFELAKQEFQAAVQGVVSYAETLEDDYAKEKYVHDAVIQLAEYDESVSSSLSQSAYSALVMGQTVCAGYSRAFQYIMQELGLVTYYCVGYANGDHAWNIVELSDGYYNADVTWDDNEAAQYDYFNIPDVYFSETHTRSGLSQQLPACSATGYYNPGSGTDDDIAQPDDTEPTGDMPDGQPEDMETPETDMPDNVRPDMELRDTEEPENGESDDAQPDVEKPDGEMPENGTPNNAQPDMEAPPGGRMNGNTSPDITPENGQESLGESGYGSIPARPHTAFVQRGSTSG